MGSAKLPRVLAHDGRTQGDGAEMSKRTVIASLMVVALLTGAVALRGLLGGDDAGFTSVSSVRDIAQDNTASSSLSAPDTPQAVNTSLLGGQALGKPDKVDVCHITGNGGLNLINVRVNAVAAHRAHGDALPGELVPGSTTLVYDENCTEVPGIAIEKSTSDAGGTFEDADTAPGPVLGFGAVVSWHYEVANTGNVPLTNVGVTDDKGVVVTCPRATLAVGESMTCTGSGTVTSGQYENLGTATGSPPAGADVSASDPSHYFGAHAAVDIEKSTNGFGADTAPGPEVVKGTLVSWTYVVTNVGQEDLTSVSVTDDREGVSVTTCPQTTLVSTESMTCTASALATLDQYQNIGTVEATVVSTGTTVTDSDASHYLGIPVPSPDISMEKTTNGVDADELDSGPTLSVGATVFWEYAVTNTGNTALFPVVVIDSDDGLTLDCHALDADGPLLPGETRSCTANGPVVEGDYENTGTATGTPSDAQGAPLGLPDVLGSDLSHYTGVTTGSDGVDIEKFTEDQDGDLHDADATPGPTLSIGDPVGWVYVVTNTGSTTLENVTVTDDDQGVTVVCLQGVGNNSVSQHVNGSAVLAPGGILECSGSGTVTAGQYTNVGEVNADRFGGGASVSDTDASHYFGETAAVSIDIEKDTNGFDADAAPGPTLVEGAATTWTYVVTNDGLADLTGVTVSDDDTSLVVDCSPGIPDPFLAGTSFSCTATGTATVGQYKNVGIATGVGPSGTVTDSDRSHYFVALPAGAAISIEKSTNGEDADSPTDPNLPQIPQGQQVTWVYEVTNTGGVDLFNVVVTDSDGSLTVDCNLSGDELPPGETIQCVATGMAIAGEYANIGTVTADHTCDPTCDSITDTDPSHYEGLGPVTIDIEKATNGVDADTSPIPLTVGDPVTWSYEVTNTSDEELINVVVTDDREGTVRCPQTALVIGESMTCTSINGTAGDGLYINVASVDAEALDGRVAFDSDPSQYLALPTGAGPAIDIEKLTNGQDADSAPGPTLIAGTDVTWTYILTNTGTTTVGFGAGQVILVTDDQEEEVFCPGNSLAPLESMTCTANSTVEIGLYANVGTVEVRTTNEFGSVVATDSDSSHYTGVAGPSVRIEKSTNGVDADTPALAVPLTVGDAITWEYVVENTGGVPLTNVTVTDDELGFVCSIPTIGVGQLPVSCTEIGTAVFGPYDNIGTVTADALGGSGPNGRTTVSDTDPSHYLGSPA